MIHRRNELIRNFRSLEDAGDDRLPAFYFGLPYGPGHVSTEYSDMVESLSTLTDDVIFFSELLVKDLTEHGGQVLSQYKKIAKVKKEKITSVDFTEAHEEGLMPDSTNYAKWLSGFRSSAQQGA